MLGHKVIISSLWMILTLLFAIEAKLQCRDDDNNDVDWIVAYKLPRIKNSTDKFVRRGLGYTYITSNTVGSGWTMSKKSVNQSESFLGQTLGVLYENTPERKDEDLLWLLYNDETPNKTVTLELGHTKGVVLAESDGGIWLIHSVPRYPPVPDTPKSAYSYPSSGTHFGQSFLCISLDIDQLNLVGHQLLYNEPQVFSSNIPSSLEKSLSTMVEVVKKTPIATAPWYHQVQISSLGGVSFTSFAKTRKFGKDLYADWVAPSLGTSLLVETWPNGQGKLPSECHLPFKVKNILHVNLESAKADFINHVDHSKWGVSDDNKTPWVCIGDINRMKTQETRGGGTVCISNLKLWTAYRNIVKDVEPCQKLKQMFTDVLTKFGDLWHFRWMPNWLL